GGTDAVSCEGAGAAGGIGAGRPTRNTGSASSGGAGVPSGRDSSRESRRDASAERVGRLAAGARGSSGFGSLMTQQGRNETVEVSETEAGERLDRVLAAHVEGFSRSRLKNLVRQGRVALSGPPIPDPGPPGNAGDSLA